MANKKQKKPVVHNRRSGEDGWTPRHRPGGIYCASLCGMGCKLKDYEYAKKVAKAWAARLGAGWKGHVWENLGWHWCLVALDGRLNVHPNDARDTSRWVAYLDDTPGPGGRWVALDDDPLKAAHAVLCLARTEMRKIQALVEAAEGLSWVGKSSRKGR